MWIYQKNEKGSALINVDHVSRFYVNKSAVYANIGDCDIERIIGLSSEEEAERFFAWLVGKINTHDNVRNWQVIYTAKPVDIYGRKKD